MTPEGRALKGGKLSKEEGEKVARKLLQKISDELYAENDMNPKSDGIALVDPFSGMTNATAKIGTVHQQQANIVNAARRIESEFSRFIAQNIFGMTINTVGLDYITRFRTDSEEYLITKSRKFDRKHNTPSATFDKGAVERAVERTLLKLQELYDQTLAFGGMRQEKLLKYIKSVAYNINRFDWMAKRAKSYSDLMRVFASFHHIMTESTSMQARFRRI